MTKTQEKAQELNAKRTQLFQLQDQYKTGIDGRTGMPIYDYPDGVELEIDRRITELKGLTEEYTIVSRAEKAAENEKALSELNQIERKYTQLSHAEAIAGGGVIGGRLPAQYKSLGHSVIDHPRFKLRGERNNTFSIEFDDLDFKTLMTGAGTPGFAPANNRTDLVVPYPNRPLRVVDLIPITPTDLSSVVWMEQTTFTNNASMTGEGYTKPESTVDYDPVTSPVRKIAHVMSITDEIMNDVPGFMSLINNDMVLMLGLKEEQQILLGSGIGQELTGILSHGSLQTQGFSTNNADTIMKAITKVAWTGYGSPTAVIMHPANWETIRLLKGATNQDYVLGSPLIDVAPRLWGIPVVVTNAITQNTALVGDFSMFTEIRRKMGVTVEVSNSHSTYFAENKLMLRAEMREALLIKRGSAFCSATSLT